MNKTLGDILSLKAFNSEHFQSLYAALLISFGNFKLREEVEFSSSSITELCIYADIFSNSLSSQYRMLSYDIASKLLQINESNNDVIKIARSVFLKLGLFLTEDIFIKKGKKLNFEKEISALSKKSLQKNEFGTETFTDIQYHLLKQLNNERVFSFSGPTSFGKSFIIKTITISLAAKAQNVVILVPTKALIDEFVIDLRLKIVELEYKNINLIKNAGSFNEKMSNIMIFTPERFNSLLFSEIQARIDCIIVDEAQKLGFNDERAITQFKVISKALEINQGTKIFFSSPVISNPDIFLRTFDLNEDKFEVIKESPVNQNLFLIDLEQSQISMLNGVTNKFQKIDNVTKFTSKLDAIVNLSSATDSSLIYCSSKQKSISEALALANFLGEKKKCPTLNQASKTIKQYIHDKYYLCELLEYGIAYHNADLPNFIKDLVEELYREKKIKFLFATSTLLEGVNLPTSNIFITSVSYKKTRENESRLNFWNLAGRAGRYAKELDGNIYCIKESPKDWASFDKLIDNKQDIEIDSTALSQLSRGQKILNSIDKEYDPNASKDERIFEQLINLIIASFGESRLNHGKNLLSLIPTKFHSKLIEKINLQLSKINDSRLPLSILNSAHTIPLIIQKNAMRSVTSEPIILEQLMGDSVYEYVRAILQIYETNLNENQIKRYAVMASQWIDGEPLRSMIDGSIKATKSVYLDFNKVEFNNNDPLHVNTIINEVIKTIEQYLSYRLEVFTSHYYKCLLSVHGEAYSGQNLASFLELGTKNKKQMALQNYGFSRAAAIEISKVTSDAMKFDAENNIVSIDLKRLISRFDQASLAYREIKKFFM